MVNYHASYIDGYRGNQSSNAAWMRSNIKNFSSKTVIELDLTDIQITEISSNKAKVTFKQKYSADKLQESTNKVLMMSKVGGAWLIEREASQ
jgi:viroplasmin and RNaseH domain-containing protein